MRWTGPPRPPPQRQQVVAALHPGTRSIAGSRVPAEHDLVAVQLRDEERANLTALRKPVRRVKVDRERPCEAVHIELVGGVVEHPPYSHASVPGGVVDEHEHVYIRVFDGLLPPGTR